MKHFLIVGYPDTEGRETPKVLMGIEKPANVVCNAYHEAKQAHQFPKGIKRMELIACETENVAIWISDTAGADVENFKAIQKAAVEKVAADRKAKIDAAAALVKAKKEQGIANVKREQARGKLATVKASLDAAEKAGVKLKEHQNRLDAAQAEFDAADKAWTEAKATLAALLAPKPVEVAA